MSNEFLNADVAPIEKSGTEAWRINWVNLLGLISFHLLALLAFTPWFFSWTGVVLAVAGQFVIGLLGINLCYHRLLTHRSFSCPRWLEYTIAILGVISCQDAPTFWVAVHRRHHQFADTEHDPHSPRRSFFWAHDGWLVLMNDAIDHDAVVQRYARDLMRQPFYAWLHKHWTTVVTLSMFVFFAAGTAGALFSGMPTAEAIQYGFGIMLWGGFVRTVLTWHYTNAINSVTHIWGYRNYETKDNSRNNFVMAFFAHGEGWHNNHHADPNSALHGHKWWEVDTTFWVIRTLAAVGLAKDIVMPARTGDMIGK